MPPGLPPWHSARGLPLPGGGHLPQNWQAYPQHCRPHTSTGSLTNIFSKNSLAQVPGLGSVAYLMTCSAPSREETTALLDAGNIVGVAPGGGRQVANKRTNKQTNNIVGVAPLDYVPKLAHETAMPGRESGREYFFV